ncbi:hypothetical protein D9619_011845 [Psilocybe cf. subviscida]|uniref:Aminoglycoside phosphotransferase domain-containing protein n=1 Tax=Psilocybe cf. subviscida TaxID=2480587 RepID=A0A8H5B0B1_9AGAR|nr:hypothetical protein D9619_011845 [Psilocybe cf. subviscida]
MNCRSNIVNQQRPSSVDALSDEDIYSLIELAHASKSVVVNTAAQQWCMPPTVWHITYDAVVKRCDLAEPSIMSYVSSQTSIPIPRVRRVLPINRSSPETSAGHYLVMDYLEGDTLYAAWPKLSWWRRLHIMWLMRRYIRQLHTLPLPFPDLPGRVDSSGTSYVCYGRYFTESGAGPFRSYPEMADWFDLKRFNQLVDTHRFYGTVNRTLPKFDRTQPLVLCHLDLHMNNIIVGPDGIPWLIDWGSSGAFPAWLEYAFLVQWVEEIWNPAPKIWTWGARVIVGNYDKYVTNYLQHLDWDRVAFNEPLDYFTNLCIDVD